MGRVCRLFLLLSILVLVGHAQQSETVSGYVTDTLCGRKGANARHVDCARRSVAAGTAQYALYDEETRRLYVLEPQSTAAQYAGQRVKVTEIILVNAKVTGAVGYSPLTRAGQVYDSKDRKDASVSLVSAKVHAPTPGIANPRVLDTSVGGGAIIEGTSSSAPRPGC